MPCFRPLKGYRSKILNPSGKRSIVFSPREANTIDLPDVLTLPCGQCLYCRLEHSRNWAVRCSHEASMYDLNCFVTLTYSDEFLPSNGSVDPNAPVLFMERLRKKFGPDIRSFGCAEYGEKLSRPHYHLCIFNFDFLDKKEWSKSNENKLYISKDLQDLWPYGHTTVGDLTFESAAYVARYVTKKITGKTAPEHYERPGPTPGEIYDLLPERSVSVSRMPGIGRPWLEKYADFVLNNDFVVSRGKRVRPPKYYDRILEKNFPEKFKKIKENRRTAGEQMNEKLLAEDHAAVLNYFKRHNELEHAAPFPKPRIYVMEEVKTLQAQLLKRGLENG